MIQRSNCNKLLVSLFAVLVLLAISPISIHAVKTLNVITSAWEGTTNFVKGRVGMTNMYSVLVALVENPEKSDIAGKVGYIITPGDKGAPLTGGGWSLSIQNYISNDNKNLAFEYLKFLTSRDIQMMMALKLAKGPTRKDILLPIEYDELLPADAKNKDPPV